MSCCSNLISALLSPLIAAVASRSFYHLLHCIFISASNITHQLPQSWPSLRKYNFLIWHQQSSCPSETSVISGLSRGAIPRRRSFKTSNHQQCQPCNRRIQHPPAGPISHARTLRTLPASYIGFQCQARKNCDILDSKPPTRRALEMSNAAYAKIFSKLR